jgi:tetratricopeptide (TPR) repeat protein
VKDDDFTGRHSPPPPRSPPNNTREVTSSPRPSSILSGTTTTTTHQHHDALLAQLVDMGFGIEESQVALEESGNVDLQSAIDIIVQQTEAMRRQQQQQQQRPKDESSTSTPDNVDSPTSETSFQQQKERLVSQASELGGYFYKNASLLVRSGKQKISKVMEDYQQQQQQQQQQQPGRPKWMTEQGVDDLDDGAQNGSLEKFVDSDDEDDEAENQRMMEQMEQERRQVEALRQKQHKERQQRQKPVFKSRLIQDDDDEENTYVSPSRRRQQPASRPTTPKRAPTPPPPPPPPTRPIIEASPTALASATTHRQKGNELYKLGQFADAEVEYTLAIDTLPSGHDHLILLGNNRALTRLKTGHYKQCIEDCDQVLALTATLQQGTTVQSQGGVDIVGRDHTIKALHRKSEALEHLEKYQQALDTYHVLVQWEGTANRKVNQAMARCRQILQPPPQKKSTATPIPRSTTTPQGDSKAVSAMRAQAAQQEADDAERLAKTDQVNLQLARWKQGKEANLRALLATLDTVLWADAKWTSIQISELIQPKKCKINYLKAIGKVHPDKVSANVMVGCVCVREDLT